MSPSLPSPVRSLPSTTQVLPVTQTLYPVPILSIPYRIVTRRQTFLPPSLTQLPTCSPARAVYFGGATSRMIGNKRLKSSEAITVDSLLCRRYTFPCLPSGLLLNLSTPYQPLLDTGMTILASVTSSRLCYWRERGGN